MSIKVEEVSYPSASPATFWEAARGLRETEGRGRLFAPAGPTPKGGRPAVVLLPGLGGIAESREPRYGELFAGRGAVAVASDSFGERGAGAASLLRRALTVTEAMITADAYAAARFLASLPEVDPERIAVIGFSYGGLSAVLSAYAQVADIFAPSDAPRFCAHASLYGCSVARLAHPVTTGAPVRIVVGDRDRNTDLEHVRAIAGDLRRGGSEVELAVYPGVYHQWDGPHREVTRVRPSPRRLRLVLDRDNTARDPRTGLAIRAGRAARGAALVAGMDPFGYDMLRDEGVMARSDAELLAFLDQAMTGVSGFPVPLAGRG